MYMNQYSCEEYFIYPIRILSYMSICLFVRVSLIVIMITVWSIINGIYVKILFLYLLNHWLISLANRRFRIESRFTFSLSWRSVFSTMAGAARNRPLWGINGVWLSVADLRGVPRTRTLWVQILSFSCSFRQKKLQNNRLGHSFWEWTHLPQENPGSATDFTLIRRSL